MSTPPPPLDNTESKANNICQVCGDDASNINYGALTCLSCRTFFRRNGFHTKDVYTCRSGGACDVTKSTRRYCTACRLAKCIAVGMSSDLIRKEDLTGTKRKLTQSHSEELLPNTTVTVIPRASPLDFPPDGSLEYLSITEWNIISNVVHAFDTFSPVREIRRTIETRNTAAASSLQFDINQSIQLITSFSNCLQLFISSTPDFKVLTTSEQWSLMQRNMFGILAIGALYLMRESGIFDKPENELVIVPLYGSEVVQQAKQISEHLAFDPIVIKLMLIALAFSSNCFTNHNRESMDRDSLLLGTFRLFGSQNVYVELIWKYLIYRYNYNESVQRFCKLVTRLLDTIKLSVETYETNRTFQTCIDNIIEQSEKSPVINKQTIIPLWGKH